MRKSNGYRTNTRNLLKKNPWEQGAIGPSRILHDYQPGEKVVVKMEASVHKGMLHRRYHGKIGVIVDKRDRAYVIDVTPRKLTREIIGGPEQLKPHVGG